ncbi:MAG TPA: hypothetical protein VIY29_18785 [Ktedonobacteraceae bacterium]
MATIITNYTAYDLAHYYADLKRLPRLSREERQHLVTGMSEVQAALTMPQETQVKQQLIEDYLSFAKYLAITLWPPTLYQRLLPDLIRAVKAYRIFPSHKEEVLKNRAKQEHDHEAP